jgi:hypothetical protein
MRLKSNDAVKASVEASAFIICTAAVFGYIVYLTHLQPLVGIIAIVFVVITLSHELKWSGLAFILGLVFYTGLVLVDIYFMAKNHDTKNYLYPAVSYLVVVSILLIPKLWTRIRGKKS